MDRIKLFSFVVVMLSGVTASLNDSNCAVPLTELCESPQLAVDCNVFVECFNSKYYNHRKHQPHHQNHNNRQDPSNIFSKECEMCSNLRNDFIAYAQHNLGKMEPFLFGVCHYMIRIGHIKNFGDCIHAIKNVESQVPNHLVDYLQTQICKKNLVCPR